MSLVAKAVFILLLVSFNVASTDYAGVPAAYTNDSTGTHGVILPVPYHNQGDTSWCLYYCLAMMADYNNRHIEPWMIASHFSSGNSETFSGQYNPFDHSLEDHMEGNYSLVIRKRVWGNSLRPVDAESLNSVVKSNIDRGQPVLMAFQYNTPEGTKAGHAVLAVGYDESSIYISDPSGALTVDLFGKDGKYIAVPISWEEFNEQLTGNVKASNMAFTIEVLDSAPASTPAGSVYLADYSDHGYSYLSFVNRTDSTDIGLLRLDGSRRGYYIARASDVSSYREPTLNDSMWVFFTVANPFPEKKTYVVVNELIRKDTGDSMKTFHYLMEMEAPPYGMTSKGVNYSNQLGSVSPGAYSVVVTLLDSEMQEITSTSIDINIS